jgi:hypothetical protein
VVITRHPFGSGIFTISQPASPRKSADFEEKMEVDQAKTWMQDRFAAVARESDVRATPAHLAIYNSSLRRTTPVPGLSREILQPIPDTSGLYFIGGTS